MKGVRGADGRSSPRRSARRDPIPARVLVDPCRDGVGPQRHPRQASRKRGRALGRPRARRRETTARSPIPGRGNSHRTIRSLLMQQLTPARAPQLDWAPRAPHRRAPLATRRTRAPRGEHPCGVGVAQRPLERGLVGIGDSRESIVVVDDARDRVDLGPAVDPFQTRRDHVRRNATPYPPSGYVQVIAPSELHTR